jgi:hypothetical protein
MNTLNNPLFMAMYELPYPPSIDDQPSGSPIEQLRDTIDAHARAEAEALGQYEYLATHSGDPVIALVMRLVLEDEERHGSKLLHALADQQRSLDSGLHSLLIDMMAMDSEKHAMLLQFVQRRLEDAAAE